MRPPFGTIELLRKVVVGSLTGLRISQWLPRLHLKKTLVRGGGFEEFDDSLRRIETLHDASLATDFGRVPFYFRRIMRFIRAFWILSLILVLAKTASGQKLDTARIDQALGRSGQQTADV